MEAPTCNNCGYQWWWFDPCCSNPKFKESKMGNQKQITEINIKIQELQYEVDKLSEPEYKLGVWYNTTEGVRMFVNVAGNFQAINENGISQNSRTKLENLISFYSRHGEITCK